MMASRARRASGRACERLGMRKQDLWRGGRTAGSLNLCVWKNKVRFHDTMTLRGDGTVLNTAYVTKFGFPVAWTRVEFWRR